LRRKNNFILFFGILFLIPNYFLSGKIKIIEKSSDKI